MWWQVILLLVFISSLPAIGEAIVGMIEFCAWIFVILIVIGVIGNLTGS